MKRIQAVLVVVAILAGCQSNSHDIAVSSPSGQSDVLVTDWRIIAGAKSTVRIGATESEVRRLLGQPTQVSSAAATTIRWFYYTGGDPLSWAYVDFKDGKTARVESGWAPHCR